MGKGGLERALLVLCGILFLKPVLVWGGQVLFPHQTSLSWRYAGLLGREALLLLLPALWLRPLWGRRFRQECWHCPPMSQWIGCLLLGVCAQFGLSLVGSQWMAWTGLLSQSVPMPGNWAETALAVLSLCLMPAVAEEMFFRRALLDEAD